MDGIPTMHVYLSMILYIKSSVKNLIHYLVKTLSIVLQQGSFDCDKKASLTPERD